MRPHALEALLQNIFEAEIVPVEVVPRSIWQGIDAKRGKQEDREEFEDHLDLFNGLEKIMPWY